MYLGLAAVGIFRRRVAKYRIVDVSMFRGRRDRARYRGRPNKGRPVEEYWSGNSRTATPWPPCSPDIAPCDYGLSGCVEHRGPRKAPGDLSGLEDALIDVIDEFPKDIIDKICDAPPRRLARCVVLGGADEGKSHGMPSG